MLVLMMMVLMRMVRIQMLQLVLVQMLALLVRMLERIVDLLLQLLLLLVLLLRMQHHLLQQAFRFSSAFLLRRRGLSELTATTARLAHDALLQNRADLRREQRQIRLLLAQAAERLLGFLQLLQQPGAVFVVEKLGQIGAAATSVQTVQTAVLRQQRLVAQ